MPIRKERKMVTRSKIKFGLVICIILLSTIQPYLCEAQEGTSTKTLKIGGIMPLSGKGAALGVPFHDTIIMQAEEYNKAGGILVGKQKYKIELIIEDSRYTADGVKAAAEKLIYRDRVKFILGPVISPGCLLINPIAEENKILHLMNSVSPKSLGREYTFAFRPYMTSTERTPSQYLWMKKNMPDVKRIGTININDETGYTTATAVAKATKDFGFEFCEPVYFPRGTSDFFPMMTKLLSTKPDFIDFGSSALGEVALEVRAARQLGYKGYLSLSFPQDPLELCRIAGKENAEGFIFMDTLIAEALPSTKAFKEAYVTRWGSWNPYALKWCVFLPVLVDSLKAAGTVEDTAKIRDIMAKMEFNTIMGHLKWAGLKTYGIARQIYTPFGIAKVENCNLVSLGILPAEKVMEAMGEK